LDGDVQEPPVEALEPASVLLIRESAAVHLEQVARGRQCLTDAWEVGGGGVGKGEYGYLMGWSRTLAGGVELAV
jgi:hypothetical protein